MPPLISLHDVAVDVNHQKILYDISFAIHSNKVITLLGPNGAGKSTLVKIILGLIEPTSGKVVREPGLTIGYVPQSINLNTTLPITVRRFMRLNRTLTDQNVIDVLSLVDGARLIDKSMHQLSGGELQRVLLAQALAKRPKLLILDEPTQGVDVSGQILLYDLIASTCSQFNCGVLMVSHDLHLVMAKTDEVICLNHHICCSGSPKMVSNAPEFISLFGKDAAKKIAVYEHHHNHQHEVTYHGRIVLPNFIKGNKND